MSVIMVKLAVACGCLSALTWLLLLFSVSGIDDLEFMRMRTNEDAYRAHRVAFTVAVAFWLLRLLSVVFVCVAAVAWLFEA